MLISGVVPFLPLTSDMPSASAMKKAAAKKQKEKDMMAKKLGKKDSGYNFYSSFYDQISLELVDFKFIKKIYYCFIYIKHSAQKAHLNMPENNFRKLYSRIFYLSNLKPGYYKTGMLIFFKI